MRSMVSMLTGEKASGMPHEALMAVTRLPFERTTMRPETISVETILKGTGRLSNETVALYCTEANLGTR